MGRTKGRGGGRGFPQPFLTRYFRSPSFLAIRLAEEALVRPHTTPGSWGGGGGRRPWRRRRLERRERKEDKPFLLLL